MLTNFDNIDFNNPKDLNDFWDAMERANNMSILHTDYPINNREDFADYFHDITEFLQYVCNDYTYEQDDYRFSLYMDKDGNIIIEEQPINDLVVLFDTTIHKYAVDESWRYIAMNWFDMVCGCSIWKM